jgi:hypothetical protein
VAVVSVLITYIRTYEGWLYLAVVLDPFSRQVIGWSMKPQMTSDLAIDALLMAVWRRKPKQEVMIHSDQGSQCSSTDWRRFLKANNLIGSMSRRANCHDNAVAESFFQLLKRERIKRKIYGTRLDARADVSLAQLKRQQDKLEKHIAAYLAQLDEADRAGQTESAEVIDRTAIKATLLRLQGKHADNLTCQGLMEVQQLEQFVIGEADVRMMRTHLGPWVAYNIQGAVDAEHCLILNHEVTQDGADNKQLEPMAKAAKVLLEQDELSVTADAGYSNGEQFQACEDADITAYVPPSRAINNQGDGQ